MRSKKPTSYGVLGTMGIMGVYFGLLSSLNSVAYAVSRFIDMWYWFLLLSIGFGLQVGLFVYVKRAHNANKLSSASIAINGGVSTGAMLACCLHHLVDFLPLLGLSATAIFLTKYQIAFIMFGVLSNAIGILMMLLNIKKYKLYEVNSLFEKVFNSKVMRQMGGRNE